MGLVMNTTWSDSSGQQPSGVPAHSQRRSKALAECTFVAMGVEFGTCSEGSASSATDSRKWVWQLLWLSPAQSSPPMAAPARHCTSQLRMPRRGTPARVGLQARVGILAWELSRPGAVPPTAAFFSQAAVELQAQEPPLTVGFSSLVAVGPPASEAAAPCAFHHRVPHRLVATATSLLARTPAIAVDRVAARAGAGPARQHRNLALAESSPQAAHLAPLALVEPPLMAVSPVGPAGFPSNTGARLRPAPRSAVPHRSYALVGLAIASPTPTRPASLRPAPPIHSAQPE